MVLKRNGERATKSEIKSLEKNYLRIHIQAKYAPRHCGVSPCRSFPYAIAFLRPSLKQLRSQSTTQ